MCHKTINENGEEDFIIRYYPGEYVKTSTARIRSQLAQGKKKGKEVAQLPLPMSLQPTPTSSTKKEFTEEQEELLKALLNQKVTESIARKLVENEPPEVISVQLQALSYREPKKSRTGVLIQSIRENWPLPDSFVEEQSKIDAKRKHDESKALIAACPFCRHTNGIRYRAKRGVADCTHNPEIESKYDEFN